MTADEYTTTLADPIWVKANEEKLKGLFPETWTHLGNINPLGLMFKAKLVGLDWGDQAELSKILAFLTKIGICQMNGMTIRRNPDSIFK